MKEAVEGVKDPGLMELVVKLAKKDQQLANAEQIYQHAMAVQESLLVHIGVLKTRLQLKGKSEGGGS